MPMHIADQYGKYKSVVVECLDRRGGILANAPAQLDEAIRLAEKQTHPFRCIQNWIAGLEKEIDPKGKKNIRADLEEFIREQPKLAAQMEMYLQVQKAIYEASIEEHNLKKSRKSNDLEFYDEVYAHSYGVMVNLFRLYYALPERPSDKKAIDDAALYREDLELTRGYETASMFVGAILHDFGKLTFPDELNLLNIRDDHGHVFWNFIHAHPSIGGIFIERLERQGIMPAAISKTVKAITTQHHESFGRQPDYPHTGYPKGLHGEEIDLVARLLTHADTFDAQSRRRGYKGGSDRKTVLRNIEKSQERFQLDPIVKMAAVEEMKFVKDPPMNCDKRIPLSSVAAAKSARIAA